MKKNFMILFIVICVFVPTLIHADECTPEVSKEKYPDEFNKVEADIKEANDGVKSRFAASMQRLTDSLEAAKKILTGKEFPDFTRTFSWTEEISLFGMQFNSSCEPSKTFAEKNIKQDFTTSDWEGVLGLILNYHKVYRVEEGDFKEDNYTHTVSFMTGCWVEERSEGFDMSQCPESMTARKWLLPLLLVLRSERAMKLFLPLAAEALKFEGWDKEYLTSELRSFWLASQASMPELFSYVEKADSFLKDNDKKREGWFLRRWLEKGAGEEGDEFLFVYRFWILKAAQVLQMKEAKGWAAELKGRLQETESLREKEYYLKELGASTEAPKTEKKK